jgi:hypothetical protein
MLGASMLLGMPAMAAELVINADASEPSLRNPGKASSEQSVRKTPASTVKLNVYDRESYKRSIRNWLTAHRLTWCSGMRARGCASFRSPASWRM